MALASRRPLSAILPSRPASLPRLGREVSVLEDGYFEGGRVGWRSSLISTPVVWVVLTACRQMPWRHAHREDQRRIEAVVEVEYWQRAPTTGVGPCRTP